MARFLKSGLIIPSNVASVEPPIFWCTLCKASFTKSQKALYERHVIDCSNARTDEIHAMSPRTQAPGIWGEEGWDTDLERWMRENADAVARGAKKP